MTAPRAHPLAKTDRVRSVSRALAVLDALAAHPDGQTAKGIAAALGLAVPTTYHLLNTLVESGYASRDPQTRHFTLGPRIPHLHQAYLARSWPSLGTRPFLQALHQTTEASAYLFRLFGDDAVLVDFIAGREPPLAGMGFVGYAVPAHLIAAGRVLLAWMPPDRRQAYAAGRYGHYAGPFPPADAARLEADASQVRAEGIAIDRGATTPDFWCVAAPILTSGREVNEALALVTDRSRFISDEATLIAAIVAIAQAAGKVAAAGLANGDSHEMPISPAVAEATQRALEVPH